MGLCVDAVIIGNQEKLESTEYSIIDQMNRFFGESMETALGRLIV